MTRNITIVNIAASAVTMLALTVPTAFAQGKIVCWRDASGKVVGCGDKVPQEFLGSATKELDKQGNVRKSADSAEVVAKRKAEEKEKAQAKEEENKRMVAQKRQDDALLNTFSNEKEIDLKRDRELLALNNFITQQTAALKVANERWTDVRKRVDGFEKDKKPLPPTVKEDMARAERDKTRVEQEIATNEKAKADTTTKYADYRKRFMELKGGIASATPAAAAPTATVAPAPSPARK
jgi:methionine-rich copper-binding protein CopC